MKIQLLKKLSTISYWVKDGIIMSVLDLVGQNLDAEIQRDVKNLEKLRNSTVLRLYSSIDRSLIDWANQVCQERKSKRPKRLDVIIDSGGGDIDAAYHLAKIFREIPTEELVFIVPRFAKSAATLLACGGNYIVMGETSELGPLDPQINRPDGSRFSALSIKSTLKLLKKEFDDNNIETATILSHKMNPIDLGEIERTLGISKKYLRDILETRMFPAKKHRKRIEKIAEALTTGYTHHSYLIDKNEATDKLKLDVREMSQEEWSLVQGIHWRHKRIAEIDGIGAQMQEYQLLKKLMGERGRII